MSQEVITLKLSSSEEIVARLESEDDDSLLIDKPMMVGLAPSPDGKGVGIQMMPWVASNQDGEVRIFKNQIVARTNPHVEIEKGYITQTTGLVL